MKTSDAMSIIEELIDERESSTCTKAWNVICARIGESAPTSTNIGMDAIALLSELSVAWHKECFEIKLPDFMERVDAVLAQLHHT